MELVKYADLEWKALNDRADLGITLGTIDTQIGKCFSMLPLSACKDIVAAHNASLGTLYARSEMLISSVTTKLSVTMPTLSAREQANAIGQAPLREESYQFTTDQLYALLVGTIDLRDEIRDKHGYESSAARHQAAYETIDGLNEERYLHSIGEGSSKPSQMITTPVS